MLEVEEMVNLQGQKAGSQAKRLHFGCWNMRMLVESDDTIATAVARKGGRGVAERVIDRSIYFR